MSYSDFKKINDIKKKFKINFIEDVLLFPIIQKYTIMPELATLLSKFISLALAIDTEKARSEFIIAPMLAELKLNLKQLSLFSGIEFNVDKKKGLNGLCDFILSRSKQQYSLNAPILMMVEAKNDNIKKGIAQCGAEMIAAQYFNLQHENNIKTIYGCVTTGTNWKFLKLITNDFYIDTKEYYIETPNNIMGILATIVSNK